MIFSYRNVFQFRTVKFPIRANLAKKNVDMNKKPTENLSVTLGKTEILIVLPLNAVGLRELNSLNVGLLGDPIRTALSKGQLIDIIDRTPFCQIAEFISNQNYCIFIETDIADNYSSISRWIRQTKSNGEFLPSDYDILICRKEYCIAISPCDVGISFSMN